jgi:hypothetical protein
MKIILRHHTQRSATFACGVIPCNSGVPRLEATRHTSSGLNQAANLECTLNLRVSLDRVQTQVKFKRCENRP